jgi:peptidyl-prolyl cis-trans isomerase D
MMMQGLRNAGQTWLGKALVTLMFGFLIFSFAIWGIGDIFRGGARTDKVVTVGSTSVNIEAVRSAYQQEIQRISRQIRKVLTPDQARSFGLDRQVLSRLASEATLDEDARSLNLIIPESLVVESIMSAPEFRGNNGGFDRAKFSQILRDNGLSENSFIQEQKKSIARVFLGDALTAHTQAPYSALEAMHRYGAERRAIEYITLTSAHAGSVKTPSEDELKAFFNERQTTFRAPEMRSGHVLALTPNVVSATLKLTDADVQGYYEQVKGERFGSPEQRSVDQIVFNTLDEAKAAFTKISAGATFDTIAKERNLTQEALTLGTTTKAKIFDPAVANTAFGLAKGAVSAPVAGRFGFVLVRVSEIIPENIKPFVSVQEDLRKELLQVRARDQINTLHDKIEDQRAGARPLADIAKDLGLTLTPISSMTRQGKDAEGKVITQMAEGEAVVAAFYRSDIGIDNEAITTKDGGYIWFDVTGIDKSRDRSFEESKEEVMAQWNEAEISRILKEKSAAFIEKLNAGEALGSLAKTLKLEIKTASELAREGDASGLPREVVIRVFEGALKSAGSLEQMPLNKTPERIVYRITNITVPEFIRSTKEAETLEERLRFSMAEDLLAQHILLRQKEFGLKIEPKALATALGAAGTAE